MSVVNFDNIMPQGQFHSTRASTDLMRSMSYKTEQAVLNTSLLVVLNTVHEYTVYTSLLVVLNTVHEYTVYTSILCTRVYCVHEYTVYTSILCTRVYWWF